MRIGAYQFEVTGNIDENRKADTIIGNLCSFG